MPRIGVGVGVGSGAEGGARAAPPEEDGPASRERGGTTIRLCVKVVPASSRNRIAGWLGETLKIRVTAPAERGKANGAVESTLAEALGIANDSVRVVRGRTSQRKVVEIMALSESEVHRRLSKGADRFHG